MTRTASKTQTVADLGEFGLIDRIKAMLPRGNDRVALGIGDDTAALKTSPGMLLLATCDIQVEGRHFRLEHISPHQLGRRSAAINLSDIAAMGGRPTYALVSLALPQATEVAWVDELYRGLGDELGAHGALVVGGNLSGSARDVVIDITLMGEVAEPMLVRRGGARTGDAVLVTGWLGESLLGRLALERGLDSTTPAAARVIEAHLTPAPRVREGQAVAARKGATAMIDVSDGLAADLGHICSDSGVGARLVAGALPVSPEAREVAANLGVDAIEAALHGGEDYELLFTCPVDEAERTAADVVAATGTPVARIGEIVRGEGIELVTSDGSRSSVEPRGWDHFAPVEDGLKPSST